MQETDTLGSAAIVYRLRRRQYPPIGLESTGPGIAYHEAMAEPEMTHRGGSPAHRLPIRGAWRLWPACALTVAALSIAALAIAARPTGERRAHPALDVRLITRVST